MVTLAVPAPNPILLLADDLFFVARDTISWKCQLSDRVLRLGLAAALLGEQALFRKINVRGGHLKIVNEIPPSRDALAHKVFTHLCNYRQVTSVRQWLRNLSPHANEQVEQRLVREKLLEPREIWSWRRFGKVTVNLPTANAPLGAAEARLANVLVSGRELDPTNVVLAGLVEATHLDEYVLSGYPSDAQSRARDHLRMLVNDLPPGLKNLVQETKAAVDDLVLSGRT
jgi:hypothetical protein